MFHHDISFISPMYQDKTYQDIYSSHVAHRAHPAGEQHPPKGGAYILVLLGHLETYQDNLDQKNLPRWGRIHIHIHCLHPSIICTSLQCIGSYLGTKLIHHILRTAFVVRKQHEFFARLCRRQFQLVPVQPVIV